MYKVLVYLMAAAALTQLGIRLADLENCQGRTCLARIEKASRAILRIEWRPISMFPDAIEAKRGLSSRSHPTRR